MRLLLDEKQIIWNAIGYTPTALALPAHSSTARFVLIAGGIRGSKSLSAAREALPQACQPTVGGLGWIIGPDYQQTRPEFSYLADDLTKLGNIAESWQPRQGGQALRTITGWLIETKTTDDARKLASVAPDWIIVAEAAQCDFEIYYKCIERLAQKRGWLWLSGTFERAQGWYVDLFNRWQSDNNIGGCSFSLPSWSNTYAFPGGREDPEIKLAESELPNDLFMERYGGVPCPLTNLVLKGFAYDTHVFDWVQFDESKPVEVWVDPGYSGSHYAVEFVQLHPRAETRKAYPVLPDVSVMDVWVIDELYLTHAIHEEVIAQAKMRPAWRRVNGGVGDVVMKTHPQADRAPIDVWSRKAGVFLRGQMVDIQGNIDRHKSFLRDPGSGSPRIFYNPQCKGVTSEYGRWKRKELGENLFGDPEKINCDGLKAIGYGLIDHFGATDVAPVVHAPAIARGPVTFGWGKK